MIGKYLVNLGEANKGEEKKSWNTSLLWIQIRTISPTTSVVILDTNWIKTPS